MKDLIEFIANSLVDEHDAVTVNERIERNAVVYHLFVAEDETGRVIGRDGKIANAIRILMECSVNPGHKAPVLKVM